MDPRDASASKNIEVVKVWTAGIRGGRKWRQREAKRAKHSVLDQTDGRMDGWLS